LSQSIGFYLLGVFLLTYYGIEVCPYLDDLSPASLSAIFVGAFLIFGIVRILVAKRIEIHSKGFRSFMYLHGNSEA